MDEEKNKVYIQSQNSRKSIDFPEKIDRHFPFD